MILVGSIVVLVWLVWRGAPLPGLALVTAGVGVQMVLAMRLAATTLGGVGGHAEWVREVSRRPRLARSPAWALGVGLVALGLALALAS